MRLKNIIAATVAACALTACSESDNEYYTTYFYPTTASGIETYADQTSDTTLVVSTDSWTLTNTCDWCKVTCDGKSSPISVTVPEGYMLATKLNLSLLPNTTGATRTNILQVTSSYEKIGTISTYVVQYPYLNVASPLPQLVTKDNTTTYSFTMTVPASGTLSDNSKPSIVFTVYSTDATLTSSDETWLKPAQTSGFKASAQQKVELEITKNETGAARTGTLTLTSNGVSSQITVKQSF